MSTNERYVQRDHAHNTTPEKWFAKFADKSYSACIPNSMILPTE